jgi:hypothetical protein
MTRYLLLFDSYGLIFCGGLITTRHGTPWKTPFLTVPLFLRANCCRGNLFGCYRRLETAPPATLLPPLLKAIRSELPTGVPPFLLFQSERAELPRMASASSSLALKLCAVLSFAWAVSAPPQCYDTRFRPDCSLHDLQPDGFPEDPAGSPLLPQMWSLL